MYDVGEFIWAGLAGGGLMATLLAIAATLGKSQLAHWLNKDIEAIKATHQRELEEKKAQYQRELEAYRSSLIAQTEAMKASQDVRKSLAVRLGERKFEALTRLQKASEDQAVNILPLMRAELSTARIKELHALVDGISELRLAIRNADPFLERDEVHALNIFCSEAWEAINHGLHLSQRMQQAEFDQIAERLNAAQRETDRLIRLYFDAILRMLENKI